MSATQNKSLKQIKSSGRDTTLRDEIYQYIKNNPGLCRREIADQTDLLLNSVTARISELLKEKRIEEREIKICQVTGKEVKRLYVSAGSSKETRNEHDKARLHEIRKIFKTLQKIQKKTYSVRKSDACFKHILWRKVISLTVARRRRPFICIQTIMYGVCLQIQSQMLILLSSSRLFRF